MAHSRGGQIDIIAPRSKFYQGPFGRLCPELTAWAPKGVEEHELDDFFLEFAKDNMIEVPNTKPAEINHQEQQGDEFDSRIPAGYTYFGQFIDHDITFDPTSSLQRRSDPSGLRNFRTSRLDLDSVYGRGPDDQPYLYDSCANRRGKMLIGENDDLMDLPRNPQGRALIGDMRNDENAIVSQLHLAFLLAHNKLVDRARKKNHGDPFESARTTLRWLYQWVVWNDFVVRVTVDEVFKCALRLAKTCDGRQVWELGLADLYHWRNNPFMPVEFSGAAYRFGHSMVRNSYQTNINRGASKFVPIFDNSGAEDPDDLRGFRAITSQNAIQWDWFLQMKSSSNGFPQNARKIDTKLSNSLAFLHEESAGNKLNNLPYRNLKRGWSFGLPSGTDMARKLCLEPVKLTEREIDSLWYYILREAETLPAQNAGQKLGHLGSIIVCATFAGLLKGDPYSFLNIDPCWTPDKDELLLPGVDNKDTDGNRWELSSIIRLSERD